MSRTVLTYSIFTTMSDNNPTPPEGVETEEQKPGKAAQKLKFYTVVGIMSALCLGFIWFLFSPADSAQGEGSTGLNMNVPAATVKNTEDDKRKAYEQEQYKNKQRDKQQTLQEITETYLTDDKPEKKKAEPKPDPIRTSHDTYRQINRQMSTFYQTPKEDPQVADLKKQLVELSARLEEKEKAPKPADPMELIEKSYELAAKYYPGGQAVKGVQPSVQSQTSDKEPTVTVRRALDETTSTLAEPAALTLEERN